MNKAIQPERIKNASLKIVLVAAGAIVFNVIFWQEKLAFNTFLFDVFILCALF